MKNLRTLDRRRIRSAIGWGDETCGSFIIASPIDDAPMYVIASQGGAWDHVSVSRRNRCPNWPEMDHVRKLFFEACETVMQLHVPSEENINNHPNCLHLWRPQNAVIPRPPYWMVGLKDGETIEDVRRIAEDVVT